MEIGKGQICEDYGLIGGVTTMGSTHKETVRRTLSPSLSRVCVCVCVCVFFDGMNFRRLQQIE